MRSGHSLITSYINRYPIRVFRSSRCSKFSPFTKNKHAAIYRYDGLYTIYNYFSLDNDRPGKEFSSFCLVRLGMDPLRRYVEERDEELIHAAIILLEVKSSKVHIK
jgi:hypothetical protein